MSYVDKLPSWAISLQRKTLSILSRFKASIIHLSINFTTLESLFPSFVFWKEFSAISAISEKQESTISEGLKFTDSSYRILKIQKTISLAKV